MRKYEFLDKLEDLLNEHHDIVNSCDLVSSCHNCILNKKIIDGKNIVACEALLNIRRLLRYN